MKTILVSLLLFTTPIWFTDFETARDTAAREQKYILLNFSGSDWCGPCIKMKKEVFESETFAPLASTSLVLVRADFPRNKKNQLSKEQVTHNEKLAERYNKEGKFPFTLLLDVQGKVIRVWDGYKFGSQDIFLKQLQETLSQ